MEFKSRQLVLIQAACFIIFFFTTGAAFAQHDSLVFKNGNIIVGEIKSMTKGVIIVETDYSKNDFNIEWSGLKEIYSKSRFLITLRNGGRINATFRSIDSLNRIIIEESNGQKHLTFLDDIVYMKGLKSDFWSRVYANVDLGLSVAKANNIRQLNVSSTFGFYADKWKLDLRFNNNRSQQDDVAETKRTESGIAFSFYLHKNWFLNTSVSTLSNTEQALDLRLSAKMGAGKYLVQTNKAYLGIGGGISANREIFTNNTVNRSSLEAYAGGEANFFDIGDFSFLSSLYVYSGITESGRWRSDFKFDTKYKLPHDLFFKLALTLNYDNRPAIAGNKTDYVYGFSVGWKF